ncbi:MAG: alpha/beta hydrolase family protein, partial [Planctomycetota bacterium]
GAVAKGPRSFSWRADVDATLQWVEALDEGDPKKKVEFRDKVLMQTAPFDGEPRPLIFLQLRSGGVTWGDGDLALVRSYWWKTRKARMWRIRPDQPDAEIELIFERSTEDRYSDPGRPVTKRTPRGKRVLLTTGDGNTLFLRGQGASEEGDRPFLDRFDLTTKQTERLFRSEAPYYENTVALLDEEGERILTSRETQTEPANYFIRDLKEDKLEQVTFFEHPYPQMKGVHKELVRYKRDDGVDLTATLYLPADYSEGDPPLPMIMWAYPREFKSAAAAGQVRSSPHQFVRISSLSSLLWLTQGYAVFSGPTMPIIGEGETEPNDTYVPQLVASAKAAIDEAARRGVGDPERMAIGGHSYGAFMTANLLAHSDLFRAGIARSGAYNRTLTPFGFQAEERTFWEAPEIYFEMSPFMHAEKIDEPILLIHGQADSNSGTFPMQSERLYHALKGLGATTRLVMLPHESHGYRARESVMHMLWEMTEWLDRYVKNASATEQ